MRELFIVVNRLLSPPQLRDALIPLYRAGQMGQEEVRPQFSRIARLDIGFVQGYVIAIGTRTSFSGQLRILTDKAQLRSTTRESIPVSLPN